MNEMNEITAIYEKKVISKAEKIILPAALIIAVLFDRLIVNRVDEDGFLATYAAFWMSYLIIFYLIYWNRVKKDKVLWFVSVCITALVVWCFVSLFQKQDNFEFGIITALVIPAVLMAHAQWAAHGFSIKNVDVLTMGFAWLEGWILKPITGIVALIDVSASLASEKSRPTVFRVFLAIIIVFFMMMIILPLLMGADQIFGHYVSQIFSRVSLFSLAFHGAVIMITLGLFYSFIWNIGFGVNKPIAVNDSVRIDSLISAIVLGSVILVYILFCAVQFTYLFARAGLPADMTYSEYARAGFAQTVTVCAINLLIFGVFLWRGKHGKILTSLLGSLLALTIIMLISGAVRLNLYIDAYGMTWLRLISAWFIIYLFAVIILCAFRLKKQIPLAGICALLLLIWYVALGFLNPDGFVEWYNFIYNLGDFCVNIKTSG
ncbi:MAG: DUF4173 domain-containing protein [Clostridiales bacterium]|jgi:hypothetical protein|nr:DUF4173 domain-containing protein [Clostridiales bacterium]